MGPSRPLTSIRAACKKGGGRERILFRLEGSGETSERRDCGWVWIPKRDGFESRRDRKKTMTGTERKEGPRVHEGCCVSRGSWESLVYGFILYLMVSRSPLGAFDGCDWFLHLAVVWEPWEGGGGILRKMQVRPDSSLC